MQRVIEYLEPRHDEVSEDSQPYAAAQKHCGRCGRLKSFEDFPRNRNSRDGRHCYCKECHNAQVRESKLRLHGNSRHYHLSQKYGIGEERVRQLIEDQGGACKICRERPADQVDHDHRTGRVRGILCGGCNAGLGQFGEDVDVIRRAIAYLERWKAQNPPDTVHEPPVPYILSVA